LLEKEVLDVEEVKELLGILEKNTKAKLKNNK
jgi:hypothetical protein